MQGIFTEIPSELIDPSPYQKRQRFDPESLQRLADDIKLNGLLNPVLCRVMDGRYELVHGERRWRAANLIPWQNIPAQIREMTDLEARRICAAENIHREDLTPIELIEATADWVDSCLMDIEGYQDFGDTYLERVGFLLGKMHADTQNKTVYFINKFVNKVDISFRATNRGITWQPFWTHDLRSYLKLDEEVKEICIEHNLVKSKAPELQKLKQAAPKIFEEIKETGQINLGIFVEEKYDIEEVSAKEIRQRAERETGHNIGVHFSSDTPEWYTPRQVIERVLKVMGEIDLDPCSNSHSRPNVPAKQHYTKEDDGLSQEWRGRVYMNPPYGSEVIDWIGYLCSQFESGNVTEAIALLPARTDTEWFRRLRQYLRCFIWGRLRFSGNEVGAPFPSMAVYLGKNSKRFVGAFRDIGDVYALWPTRESI